MKKTRAIFSMLLSAVMLAAAALPALAVNTPEAKYGGYYHVANNGSVTAGTNGFTGVQNGMYGSALTYLFKSSNPGLGNVQTNLSLYFDNLTAPAGTKYFAFWFGQEFDGINDAKDKILTDEWYLQQRFNLYFRDGASTANLNDVNSYKGANAAAKDQTVYTVSTDDGTVRARKISGSAITGTPSKSSNWGTFKNGYVIVPVSLIEGSEVFEEETVIDLRIKLADGAKYFNDQGEMTDDKNGISANTRLFFDNIGFITDLDAFMADIGESTGSEKGYDIYDGDIAYKLGTLTPRGFASPVGTVYSDGALAAEWDAIEGAESYILNVYDKDGGLVESIPTAETNAEVNGLTGSAYDVQVLAVPADGKIAAASAVESAGPLASYYQIANDGAEKTDVSGEGVTVELTDAVPDGAGIAAKTSVNKEGVATDQSFIRVIFKNVEIPENAEAIAFWFGQNFELRNENSVMTDEKARLMPKFRLTWSPAGESTWKSTPGGSVPVYLMSTDDGTAYTQSFDQAFTGTPSATSNWVTFKNGYVIMPVSLLASSGFGTDTIDLRITLEQNMGYISEDGTFTKSNISANTVMKFDNFGFITDMSAFTADLGDKDKELQKGKTVYSNASAAYKMGYMGPTGDTLTAEAVYADNTVSASWNEVEGAEAYDVTLYNDGVSLETARVDTTSHSFAMPKLGYTVQVIARDADGKILEISAPAAVKDGELTGDVNGDYTADIKDLIRLKKIAAGMAEETPAADIDGSGKIDSADLTLLRRLLMGV